MDRGIYFFSQNDTIPGGVAPERLGFRGRQAGELAELGFPVPPGFILDAGIAPEIGGDSAIEKDILALLDRCAGLTGKTFGGPENPLLLKAVFSPNLAVTGCPPLRGIGLVKPAVDGFAAVAGTDFAALETLRLIRGMLSIGERAKAFGARTGEREAIAAAIKKLDRIPGLARPSGREQAPPLTRGAEVYMDEYARYFPEGFFRDPRVQLRFALGEMSRILRRDDQSGPGTALLVQPLVYGNSGGDSCYGNYTSRNVITGEQKLAGLFFRAEGSGQDINRIGAPYLKELRHIARTLEDRFREIRMIRFTVEKGRLWITGQRQAERTSAQADIKLLLDLVRRKIVDRAYAVKALDPLRLNEILHPGISPASVKGFQSWKGGIAGAPGAATGRAYLSAKALLEARKKAQQTGRDTGFILVLKSSSAGDVTAIELSTGVLTAEGGYAAHASVVARQYGKVSLVAPELTIKGAGAALGDFVFSEGDYLTLDVPFDGESRVYRGKAELIEPDPGESGLLDFIALSKTFLKKFRVRCNADTPRDAALALRFGAEGVGLCRTEHMFFGAGRLNVFRETLLAEDAPEREKALEKLRVMQREDFYGIMKVMAGREVIIRLLDAPLHEFMPRNNDELADYIAHVSGTKKAKPSEAEIRARIDALREINPMLGRRGCRAAVSYPEIYAMQTRAVFEAAWQLRSEKIDARPGIMVPVVMNAPELKLIAYGKKIEGAAYAGIADIEEALRKERKAAKTEYRIGAMIELPAAALGAGEIARYAAFVSFGTNDLSQTALGISRDDFTAFMPDYTRFDLITGNPFSVLDSGVRELIALAVSRGRITRPDLVCGLCGEHGANPANLRFCMDAGLDYVSCSPYSVPVVLLAIAQAELEREGE